MAKTRSLVIAAGGTGGHMFPAQALAEAMLAAGWRVRLSTDARGARYADGFPDATEIEIVKSASFGRGGVRAKLAAPFRLLAGVLKACADQIAERPDVVIGFGGYPAFPAMAAAWITRRQRMIHEQNGVLGRVNRLFARRVHQVACGTWPTDLPRGVEAIFTGNPVRAAILERESAQYIAPGDYPMSLLVIGGSQGARVLSDVVPGAVALLPGHLRALLRVSHQARPEDVERVAAAYRDCGVDAEVRSFFDDVAARLVDAQLVVSRSGASSVADIAVIGRPAIFVPLAAALRDEQTANARGIVKADGAEMVDEETLTALGLARRIEALLTDGPRAAGMAAAAKAYGRPEATQSLVLLVEELALGKEGAA